MMPHWPVALAETGSMFHRGKDELAGNPDGIFQWQLVTEQGGDGR